MYAVYSCSLFCPILKYRDSSLLCRNLTSLVDTLAKSGYLSLHMQDSLAKSAFLDTNEDLPAC